VMSLSSANRESNPINLDQRWGRLSAGVHQLEDQLLIELSLDTLFHDKVLEAA
jgi:purine-binding chemotaxis protein CheW